MSNKNTDKMDGVFEEAKTDQSALTADKPARPPKPKTSMGRETKVGLAVIAALLVIFVIVLVIRLRGDGDGDGDVAKKGGSAKQDSRDKSDLDKPKASDSQNATMLTAQTDQRPLQSYGFNQLGADSEVAPSGYGSPSSYQNEAPVQNGSQLNDPRKGAAPAAVDNPAGRFATETNLAGSTKNPFDRAPPPDFSTTNRNMGSFLPSGNNPSLGSGNELNIGRTTTRSTVEQPVTEDATRQDLEASLPPYGNDEPYATQQASDVPADERENPGDIAPPFDNNELKVGTTALKGRRLDEIGNRQQINATGSGVRIVGDNPIDGDSGHKFATNSTELEKVQGVELSAGTIQSAVESAGDSNDIDSFTDPRFRKKQPKVVESAPLDDAMATDEDVAPARLSNAAATPSDELYTVQRNDNYWSIAQKEYGSGAYFKALYEYNRRHAGQANVIRPGAQLRLPDESTLQRLYPTLCPPPQRLADQGQARTASANVEVGPGNYEVQAGDTLFRIARRELGNGSRFAEVYELNRDQIREPTERLEPGTRLRLPDER
jgi:nucleoid-associated protein YgaU